MTQRQEYIVEGRWPFPLDMLRRDDASPATEGDSRLIRALSADHLPDFDAGLRGYEVKLFRTPMHKWDAPNFARWKSFQWEVVPESLPEHLRPVQRQQMAEADVIPVKTEQDARNRVYDIGRKAEHDPEAASGLEHEFHRDVLYSIANGIAETPKEIARAAFETFHLDFRRC